MDKVRQYGKALNALILVLLTGTCAGWQPPGETATSELTSTIPFSGGEIYYVRPDGGSATQCTGLKDAPYTGSGTGETCAWDHPFRALPPEGTPRIEGGDTLIIASGSYRMGYGASGADACETDYPWDCVMPPLPGGPDAAHPTRILGAGWDEGCPEPPELWGTERAWTILDLTGTHNVEVDCLEITDHAGCAPFHSGGMACEREEFPYGDWADVGIYAEDARNVTLRQLNVHGLGSAGIMAGRLHNWLVENVRVVGNGWVGWEGDIDGDDANSGTLTFRRWEVAWNGCVETWPGGQPSGCWAQTAGGYGDGVGTGATGGDWIIEESTFHHNTSDGLDLLYHSKGGRVVLDRVQAEGNAGNQVKIAGQATITNSLLIGNCTFFEDRPFTYNVDPCRALGNTLEFAYTGGEEATVVNSTLYGHGDGLIAGGPRDDGDCDGSEILTVRNTVFVGDEDYFTPGDMTFLFYQEGCRDLIMDSDYNVVTGVKNVTCRQTGDYVRSGAHDLCTDPLLETSWMPGENSPVLDAGDNAICPPVDLRGTPRPLDGDEDGTAVCDVGAYEGTTLDESAFLPVMLTETATQPGRRALANVNDWLYQLQDADLAAIGDTAYDLVVMDYASDGDDATAFTAAQIEALKHSPGGEKIVLAYLSIGEAEEYRFYWQSEWRPGEPGWLDAENPDWEGNYKVRYWDPEWQAIVFQYLDKILGAGFDGVYLDLVDAYEYYLDRGRVTAPQNMADFVAAIRAHAHAQNPDFLIFPQNAPELAELVPGYLNLVDGIGQEDLFYGYEGDDLMTPPEETRWVEQYLDLFQAAGKLVLTVDYASTPAHIDDAYAKSRARGYVPYVTVRDLDILTIHAGHEPD